MRIPRGTVQWLFTAHLATVLRALFECLVSVVMKLRATLEKFLLKLTIKNINFPRCYYYIK